jgi:hypothetical protein
VRMSQLFGMRVCEVGPNNHDGIATMPWRPDDATSHTKKATTEKTKREWAEIANQVLERTGDEGRAIREANAVIARAQQRGKGTS